MANFIIGKIIDSEGNDWGFRVFNMDDESYQDLVTKDVLSLLNNDGSSFGSISSGIVNAEEHGSSIEVAGYEDKPVIISNYGILKSNVSHTVCGFNPILNQFVLISYNGELEKLSLSKMLKKADEIGMDNISNTGILELANKKEEKDKPKSVYIGEDKTISIPNEYDSNELVKTLYNETNINLSGVIGAYILHTQTKKEDKKLRYYELDNGSNICKTDYMDFELDNSIVDTFFILEQTSKRFITIPVCKAFESLIKSFEYSDMPVEKFKDFLDFLADEADEADMLELEDEHNISTILGGNITAVKIDNTENVTYEIENGAPNLDYERMDATFTVELTEKKKSKDYVIPSFPWVIY